MPIKLTITTTRTARKVRAKSNTGDKIQAARDKCIAAFIKYPRIEFPYAWCCHHQSFYEKLKEPAKNRIRYIYTDKLQHEQERRFNNFRPIRNIAKFMKLLAEFNEAVKLLEGKEWNQRKYEKLQKEFHAKLMPMYKKDVPKGTWNERKKNIL